MDVLHGNQLVLWRDGRQEIAATLPTDGKVYVVAPMDPSLVEAIHFPVASDGFDSLDGFVSKLEAAINALCPELEPDATLCLAAFVLSSWVPECVPTAPLLNLCGELGSQTRIVDLLGCLCRRSLMLGDTSIRDLCALPAGLCPTLILTQPSRRTIQNLLAAAASQQHRFLYGGQLRKSRHATVVCTRVPLPAPACTVRMLPSANQHRLSPADASHLTEELVSRLVRYRLSRHHLVGSSTFDSPSFASETRLICRVLGAALEGGEQSQRRLLAALAATDEQHKSDRSEQTAALVLEALLVLCREEKPAAFVDEITDLVNTILLGRDEQREVSARKVGAVLRTELDVHPERRAQGYEVTLDKATRQRITRLAEAYGVLPLVSQQPGNEVHDVPEVHAAGQESSGSNVHDVHNVHAAASFEEQA